MLTFSLGFAVGFVAGMVLTTGAVGIAFLKYLEREENDWRGNGR